jgi:hypothetical protein
MKLSIEEIANVCHQVNKAYCTGLGDHSQPEWELAPDWQRQSAINGVRAHIESGLTMLPEDSHNAWMKQKSDEGWVYGLVKDVTAKTHPCMVLYSELPEHQRIKDYLFREVVHTLAKI